MSRNSKRRAITLAVAPIAPVQTPVKPPANWIAALIVSLYIVLTLGLIVKVPPLATPDANEHYLYVEHLATRGQLPVFVREGGNGPGFEFHQPPLYYLLCTPLWKATDAGVQQYACRFVALICGALTLVFVWRAARWLFPNDGRIAILATGLGALLPLHQAVGASANNDAIAGLIGAMMFERVARLSARSWRASDALVFGLLSGLAILSKGTALVLVLMAAGAVWSFATSESKARGMVRPQIKSLAIFAGTTLLVGGWWLARNQMLYGDPLALGFISARFEDIPARTWKFFASGVSLPTYLRALGLILFCTVWGFFGGVNRAIEILNPFGTRGPLRLLQMGPSAVYSTLGAMLICALATLLAILGAVRACRKWPSLPQSTRGALTWMLIGMALVVLAWGRFNLVQFQAQGRYLQPGLTPLLLIFAVGWREMLPRRVLWIVAGGFALVLLSLTASNLFVWKTLTN